MSVAHLRPLKADLVNALCDRALGIAPMSYGLRLEINGFRESRTPWDAMRLANALAYASRDEASEDCKILVRELDVLAHESAGLVPRNRP